MAVRKVITMGICSLVHKYQSFLMSQMGVHFLMRMLRKTLSSMSRLIRIEYQPTPILMSQMRASFSMRKQLKIFLSPKPYLELSLMAR